MEGGTQVNSKQYMCHFFAQQRSGTQFVWLELPVLWGCQDGSKEPSRRNLEYWTTITKHMETEVLPPRPSLGKMEELLQLNIKELNKV